MSSTLLEVSEPQCAVEDFDGEVVVLNMESGVYFSIREPAASVWRGLSEGCSVEMLVEAAGDDQAAKDAVSGFAAEVQEKGLMRPKEGEAATALPQIDFKALGAAKGPLLESFDDMQQLLLLDPVHEVTEDAGWPHQPKD